jgi:TRAP-type C4-dicarboxylate transport system permease small subunit
MKRKIIISIMVLWFAFWVLLSFWFTQIGEIARAQGAIGFALLTGLLIPLFFMLYEMRKNRREKVLSHE